MNTGAEPAAAAVMLGRAWLERGQERAAQAQLERALEQHPGHADAHRYLAHLCVRQGRFADAVEQLECALKAAPTDSSLRREAALLRELAGCAPPPLALPEQPGGRLRFASHYDRTHHRSGWRHAIEALHPLHSSTGVLFEGFLEEPFAWQHPRSGVRSGPALLAALRSRDPLTQLTSEERRIVPYRQPWVGFLHNPPNMPAWFHAQESPQAIFAKPIWQDSLRHCVGLFALSEYAGSWLRKTTGKTVSVVLHPTETPDLCFDFERFLANPRRQIIQVGWWLRRLGAIDRLPLARGNSGGYSKLRLVPNFFPGSGDYLQQLRAQEFLRDGLPAAEHAENTTELQHVPNDEYDRLLSENLVFVELYDASANNAVIECLVRATPLLVNRLPAVEEYLGAAYPLYFHDLADAAAKALDFGRIRAAHEYLAASPIRRQLDRKNFRRSVEASEVYQRL